ncbi:DUF1553 domain-containing protein [Kolteria novifilia]
MLLILTLGAFFPGIGKGASNPTDYLSGVKPLLRERCFSCHGALKQEGGLRLDTVALMIQGGDSGATIVPGDARESYLLARLAANDLDERMPPEHEGEPFTAKQLAMVRTWIDSGAPAPEGEEPEADPEDHWSFQPVVRPDVPLGEVAWRRNPIDAFLSHRHQELGLVPQPEAPRLLQVRRLYLDLVGLPPSAEEIERVVNDRSAMWYEHLVDRLLEDPRHGERWARHWMDVWRYSDWWGYRDILRNSQKHLWHWRDWIVESLNRDLPYDEMIRQMLAADELYPEDADKLRATGFLARNFYIFNRNIWLEQTVEHVSKGFLGLTMNCVKCHDHKYDPFEQADFYRMRAFFEPYHVRLDMVPGEADYERDGVPRVFDAQLEMPTYLFVRGQETRPDTSTPIEPGVPDILAFDELEIEPVALPTRAWKTELRPWTAAAHVTLAERDLAAAERSLRNLVNKQKKDSHKPDAKIERATWKVKEAEARLASVRLRAAASKAARPGVDAMAMIATRAEAVRGERALELVKRQAAVAAKQLSLDQAKGDERNAKAKKELASATKALRDAEETASKPVLLEETFTPLEGAKWATTRFLHTGRDDPPITFPAHSSGRRTALARWITDRRHPLTARVAANQLWMRHMGEPLVADVFDFGRKGSQPTHPKLLDWLASELMEHGWSMRHLHRLIVTSAAYRMSSSLAGAESNLAADPDNHYWWRRTPGRLESQVIRDSVLALAGTLDPTMGGPSVPPKSQENSKRRSLYFFHSDDKRNLFLTSFDEALPAECYRREQSIVPQQALALSNSKLVLDAVGQIATRLSEQTTDEDGFLRQAFVVILGFEPTEREIAASREVLRTWRRLPDTSEERARANLVWALINHNDFVTIR